MISTMNRNNVIETYDKRRPKDKYGSFQQKILSFEQRTADSKRESAALKSQIIKVKQRMNDEGLIQTAEGIAPLERGSNNLKQYHKLRGHQDKVASVSWSRNSHNILSVSQDGFMIIWDAVTGLKVKALVLDSEWVLTSAYSPNGRLALSAGLKNSCVIYNVMSNSGDRGPINTQLRAKQSSNSYEMSNLQPTKAVLKGHRCYISDCDFIDDNTMLTASGDLTCAVWDIDKSTRTRSFNQHLGDVLCLSINKNDRSCFVSGASDGFARLWDIRVPGPVQQFQVSNSDVTAVKFFPDGGSFAVGSDDGVVRLLDLRADCQLSDYVLPKSISQQRDRKRSSLYPNDSASLLKGDEFTLNSEIDTLGISSLDFTSSGRVLYVCYSELGCFGWDILKGNVVDELKGHSSRINQVVVSPDDMALATSSWDSTIGIWSS